MPRPGLLATMRGAGGGALEVAYGSAGDDPANSTTYTFTDMTIGSASASRTVVAVVGIRSASTISVSAVTIGGVSATVDVVRSNIDNTAYTATVIARANVPTGTTATVVATITNTAIRALAATYIINGAVTVAGSGASGLPETVSLSGTGPVTIAGTSQGSAAALTFSAGVSVDAQLVSSESALYRMTVGHSTATPSSVSVTGAGNPATAVVAYQGA